MPSKNIFIIACEPSADAHGARLMEALKKREPDIQFHGLGGSCMKTEGMKQLFDMTQISALGFGDVLRQYFTYRKIFYAALAEVNALKPDAIILIDSPAFNLRFAKKIKRRFKTIYYISPQLWAWGKRRIHDVKRVIDKMLVILPFEVSLYEKAGIPVEFVGHPLVDHLSLSDSREHLRDKLQLAPKEKAIGLLAGSRQSEVERILPLMLRSAKWIDRNVTRCRFFVSYASNVPQTVYDDILKEHPLVKVTPVKDGIHDLLGGLDFALITSGTTTLEATLIGTPFFLFYKASWSTYLLGRLLIRVKFLGLSNLLMNRAIVPEFIQHHIHPKTVAHETRVLLENRELYENMQNNFREVKEKLGGSGASERAAEAVLKTLTPQTEIPCA